MPIAKILGSSDITDKLDAPRKLLDILLDLFPEGKHEVGLEAVDGVGVRWKFRCAIRKGRYKKPCLQRKEWLHFVRSKGLRKGDKIEFNREDNEFGEKKLRIRAMRRATHGGDDDFYEMYL